MEQKGEKKGMGQNSLLVMERRWRERHVRNNETSVLLYVYLHAFAFAKTNHNYKFFK